ncbi:MAG: flagellar protein export ATPase FliI [Spirochaetes bacterium]|nr:flagellar protein export ATPase FliI [Spirochaetota bacterium]
MSILDKYENLLNNIETVKLGGKVKRVIGVTVEGTGPQANIGELCKIIITDRTNRNEEKVLNAEVVGFREDGIVLMPYGSISGISQGCQIIGTGKTLEIPVSNSLLGRIVNGKCEPIDNKGSLIPDDHYSIFRGSPEALKRKRIKKKLSVGIKAIDGLLTIGEGQRVGIFSGSGIGKSTLLGMISRFTEADVNVIALIGERGREVNDFLENDLGKEGLKKSVVVVATSDEAPILRLRGAFVATTIAEYFRDQGLKVMLLMDSITRFARAQREIGLSVGEPPSTRGFPPSVFSMLPVLLERSGASDKGSITAFYTILVEADDMNEPIADNVRGILDGHIVLSRDLASLNHYPPIDILESISRLMVHVTDQDHVDIALKIKEILATYREAYDLINIGAYAKGSNPRIDHAIKMIDKVNEFLKQGIYEKYTFQETLDLLKAIFESEQEEKTIKRSRLNTLNLTGVTGEKISIPPAKIT